MYSPFSYFYKSCLSLVGILLLTSIGKLCKYVFFKERFFFVQMKKFKISKPIYEILCIQGILGLNNIENIKLPQIIPNLHKRDITLNRI